MAPSFIQFLLPVTITFRAAARINKCYGHWRTGS